MRSCVRGHCVDNICHVGSSSLATPCGRVQSQAIRERVIWLMLLHVSTAVFTCRSTIIGHLPLARLGVWQPPRLSEWGGGGVALHKCVTGHQSSSSCSRVLFDSELKRLEAFAIAVCAGRLKHSEGRHSIPLQWLLFYDSFHLSCRSASLVNWIGLASSPFLRLHHHQHIASRQMIPLLSHSRLILALVRFSLSYSR